MADEIKLTPSDTVEKTGKQDLFGAVSGGMLSAGIGSPLMPGWGGVPSANLGLGMGNTFGMGAGGGFFNWSGYGPQLALVGTDPASNKYSSPLMGGTTWPGMLPGYSKPWPGVYATYRIMSAHPTLVLCVMGKLANVLGSHWQIEETGDAPAGAKEYLEKYILPMRTQTIIESYKALIFGNKPFETIQEERDGYWTVKRLKPLLPELTEIYIDDKGNFDGLENVGTKLLPKDSFLVTWDKDGDNWYGRSRMENVRRSWSNWLQTEDNLARLGSKVSSIIPFIGYPPGEGVDQQGQKTSNFQLAGTMAQGMASGRPVVFPNMSTLTLDDLRNLPDMAKSAMWAIDTIDMGNPGPAIEQIREQLIYYDRLLVRGWVAPERSLLESRHGGSKSDSESHGEVAISDDDLIHMELTRQFDEQVVQREILYNFGPKAVGTIHVEAAAIQDSKRLLDKAITDAVLANPEALREFMAHTDMDAWMSRVGLQNVGDDGPWELPDPQPAGAGGANPTGRPQERFNVKRKNGNRRVME